MSIIRAGAIAGVCLAAGAAAAHAQSSGSIAGVVRDATGAVLPGVTVEAASPVLIEKVRTAVTDDQGQYKILDLRPGAYAVTFTLAGFNTVKREGIELTAAFTAPVNAELRVGSVEETITVTGESPIVDTHGLVQQKVMTRDVIDAVPTGKTFQNIGVLIPGMVISAGGTGATPNDVGGSAGEQQVQMAIHGGRTQDMLIQMDGMRFNNFCGSGSYSGISGNDALVEQIAFETGAISAEVSTGGIRVNMIPKEGGNTFRGSFFVNGANDGMQSSNYTEELRLRGLETPDSIKKVWDVNFSLGGPIRRDRLWFLFATRYWGADRIAADGFYDRDPRHWVYDPDLSRPGVDDSWNLSNALRLTWQVSPRNKVNLYYDLQDRCTCHWFVGEGGIFGLVTPEASWIQETPRAYLAQAKWVSTLTNRVLLDAGLSIYSQEYTRWPQPGVSDTAFSVIDATTNRRHNAAPYYSEHFSTNRVYSAGLSYVTGSHAFKVGMNLSEGTRREYATVNNDMTLVFQGETPVQAIITASPRDAKDRVKADLGMYAQDQWTIDRFTLNLGLRFDYFNSQIDEQVFPAGRFVGVRRTDTIEDLPDWRDLSPRLGVSWDVFGTGRTAVKTSLSRYVNSITLGLTSQFNPLGSTVTGSGFSGAGSDTRTWQDQNGDRIPQLNELGPTSNPLFGQSALTTVPSDEYRSGWSKRAFNWEYSASIQHEILPRVSVGAAYFRRWFGNFTITDALQVGPGDYEPFTIRGPGDPRLPGGGGEVISLFDVRPALRPLLSIDRRVGLDKARKETYDGFDLTVSARMNNGMLLAGGVNTGRTNTENCTVFDSPDQRFCKTERPFLTQLKIMGAYTLPLDIQLSGSFQSVPGPQITASWSITNAVANAGPQPLGRNLAAGRATVALIQPGTLYGERMNQVDFRVAKIFRMGRRRLQVMADLYNALNAAAILTQNNTFGPQWQRPTGILQGRLFKTGAQFNF